MVILEPHGDDALLSASSLLPFCSSVYTLFNDRSSDRLREFFPNLLNVKRMHDRGVERTLGEYDLQCEDVGINLLCLERGCSIARLSSIVFSCPSHEDLPRTEKTLFGEENPLMKKVYDHIRSKPIGVYAKPTVKFSDGTPAVIGIDWRKYNRDKNSGKVVRYSEHCN